MLVEGEPQGHILSVALADLLVLVTCVPFISSGYVLEYWPWGTEICKLSETTRDIFTVVSTFTLTVLSAERYYATIRPLYHFQTKSYTIKITILIWILACVLALPSAIFSNVEDIDLPNNKSIQICTPFSDKSYLKNYMKGSVVAKALTYYILPLCAIVGFYVLMARRLQASAQELVGEFHGAEKVAQVRRHVARVLLAFIIVFFLCFLPYQIFGLWLHVNPTSFDDFTYFRRATRISGFCLSFLNACVNPIALYCLSGAFRQHNRMNCLCAETCCLLLIYFQLCAVSKLNEKI